MRISLPFSRGVAALLVALAMGQETSAQPRQAEDTGRTLALLIADERYDEARGVLHGQVAGSPDAALHIAHLEGLIRLHQGRVTDAIDIFRAILAAEPNFLPSRVELARALLRAGDPEASAHHFEAIAHGSDDPALQRFASRYLQTIESNRTSGASFYLSALPSTNFNKGSGQRTFEAGGLLFTIDEDSRQKSGVGLATGGSAFKTFRLGEAYALTATGGIDLKKYKDSTHHDEVGVSGNLALSRRFGQVTAAIGPTFEYRWSGWKPYLMRYGIAVGARMSVGQRNLVGLTLAAVRQDYAHLDFRDGAKLSGNVSFRRLLSPSLSMTGRLGFDIERTQRPHLDHNDIIAGFQIDQEWRGGLLTTLTASYESHRFLGTFPGTDFSRRDKKISVGGRIAHRSFSIGGFAPQLSYQYSRQRSNISFYDYHSHDLGLSLTRQF